MTILYSKMHYTNLLLYSPRLKKKKKKSNLLSFYKQELEVEAHFET